LQFLKHPVVSEEKQYFDYAFLFCHTIALGPFPIHFFCNTLLQFLENIIFLPIHFVLFHLANIDFSFFISVSCKGKINMAVSI